MIDQITNSKTVNVLSQALGAANLRNKVISNNIANFNTPGFKKSRVAFEDILAQQLAPEANKLQLARTKGKHFPIEKENGIAPEVSAVSNTTMRTDGNNVDVDVEMADLAKNSIYYNAIVRQIGSHFTGLKSIISGQK